MPKSSSNKSKTHRIAWFISPHGFGHAALSSGVMAAIQEIAPDVQFEIFTRIPPWFFQDSVSGIPGYHSLLTDIGLVQKSPLYEDMEQTLQALDDFLPFPSARIAGLSAELQRLQCDLVVCDIAPMGIAVACEARIPSVLVENFTWDWIYEGYRKNERLKKHTSYLRNLFESADYHIQTEPICQHKDADLVTLPVSRKIRAPRQVIRQRLGIPDDKKMVVITMGGIREAYNFFDELAEHDDIFFVVPGAKETHNFMTPTEKKNLILLPHHSDFFHPDLIHASDAVIGKVGYSTIAEIYHAGVPFGYILRPTFPESEKLAAFVEKEMPGRLIDEADFHSGKWLSSLETLFALPRIQRNCLNGADQAAELIYHLLKSQ